MASQIRRVFSAIAGMFVICSLLSPVAAQATETDTDVPKQAAPSETVVSSRGDDRQGVRVSKARVSSGGRVVSARVAWDPVLLKKPGRSRLSIRVVALDEGRPTVVKSQVKASGPRVSTVRFTLSAAKAVVARKASRMAVSASQQWAPRSSALFTRNFVAVANAKTTVRAVSSTSGPCGRRVIGSSENAPHCDFTGGVLSRSRLTRMNFRQADLTAVDFRRSKLDNSDLAETTVSGANVAGADFTGAQVQGSTGEVVGVPAKGPTPGSRETPASVVPNAPGAPASSAFGNAAVTLQWAASSEPGTSAITGYSVRHATSVDGSYEDTAGCTNLAAVLTCTAAGLTNGQHYWFKVRATSSAGHGQYSTAGGPFTPSTTPGAPTGVQADALNSAADVSWSALANTGGSPVTAYTATATADGQTTRTCTSDSGDPIALSCEIDGLVNGVEYAVTVTAANVNGDSPASDPAAMVMPLTLPSAPGVPTSSGTGNGSVVLNWTAPSSDGGSEIIGYNVQVSEQPNSSYEDASGCTTLGVVLTCTASELTNGTPYYFNVAAINAKGTGAYSDASDSFTPATTPGAPTAVQADTGNTEAFMSWNAPVNNGGAAIHSYTATAIADGQITRTCTSNTGTPIAPLCTIANLTNDVEYSVTVVAHNAKGNSAASTPAVTVTPAVPCEDDGVCAVGDAGPGGGTVFYVADTPQWWGSYLEAAPSGWYGTETDPALGWCSDSSTLLSGSFGTAIGSGKTNTDLMVAPGACTSGAGDAARDYDGGDFDDWSLPSKDELNELYLHKNVIDGLGMEAFDSNFETYYSSSQVNANNVWMMDLLTGTASQSGKMDLFGVMQARPTRAFGPAVPGAPTGVQATVGTTTATVSWTAPSSDGGAAIDSYTATATADGQTTRTCTSNTGTPVTPSCMIENLVIGVQYSVTVTAHNSRGNGPASTPIDMTPDAPSCAQGGVCAVGDTGPGGGTVFYVSADGPNTWGSYMEAAPNTWSAEGNDAPGMYWAMGSCAESNPVGATKSEIGNGRTNTARIVAQCGAGSPAAKAASDYAGGGMSDWFLPSEDELAQLYAQRADVSPLTEGTEEDPGRYWSSTEDSATDAHLLNVWAGAIDAADKQTQLLVRPIRQFGPSVPCEPVGPCGIGDTGPGGGKVFYVASYAQTWGSYLEAAPSNWYGPTDNFNFQWGTGSCQESGGGVTGTAIGIGRTNTAAIMAACNNGGDSPAARVAHQYAGGGMADWYLPSRDELNAMYQERDAVHARDDDAYWSSSNDSGMNAYVQEFWTGNVYPDFKEVSWSIRPIRQFGPSVPCMASGPCGIGQTGPGGGTVFYAADSVQSWGRYLELAPKGWNGTEADPTEAWGSGLCIENDISTSPLIGTGAANTTTAIDVCGSAAPAATLARGYEGGGFTNWSLPSKDELTAIAGQWQLLGYDEGSADYWSSTAFVSSQEGWAWLQGYDFENPPPLGPDYNSRNLIMSVRPVRAF